jgi:hypothetical protein
MVCEFGKNMQTLRSNRMGKSFNRRRNKKLRLLRELRETNEQMFEKQVRLLLFMWQKEAQFRATNFFFKDGSCTPPVWDLMRKKADIAMEAGLDQDLAEICRRAIVKQIGTSKMQLGSTGHHFIRRQNELISALNFVPQSHSSL